MKDKESVNVSIKSNKPKEIYDIAAVIAKNLGLKTEKLVEMKVMLL